MGRWYVNSGSDAKLYKLLHFRQNFWSEIKKYIEDYYLQNRQSPSTTKIAEAVGIARGTAYKYLVEMAEKNMIEYDGQEIRTNVTRKYSGEQTQTPIVGSIPCGSPQYEEENIEEYVSLPTAMLDRKSVV